MFTEEQKNILSRSKVKIKYLTEEKINKIADRRFDEGSLTDNELLEFLKVTNSLYRGGKQIISDADYDFIFLAELKSRHPDHAFLKSIEPESAFSGKTVELPVQMLSTEKAYTEDEVKRWVGRIRKASNDISIDFNTVKFHVTPKLDGFAAFDDGKKLYTRGDGKKGTDNTRVIKRGIVVAGNGKRGQGPGEIVVSKAYFNKYLSQFFENARNFQASVVKEKELEEHAAQAIKEKAAVFYPFSLLPSWVGTYEELEKDYNSILEKIWTSVDYDVDGVIIEITNNELKDYMGATRHHHRWQIAFKENVEKAEVKVLEVIPQTSPSGRVKPVAIVEPLRLRGAMIDRVTAHHYGMVKANRIGKGAVIELTRSGEVIPKIVKVIKGADPDIPETCPSCKSELVWEKDYLCCINNIECPAQITHTIEHFFKTLGNNDGFGPSTTNKLYGSGIKTLPEIYNLKVKNFIAMGFGPKQSENLFHQLKRSRSEKIEDWRFLSAFGVYRMGGGNCEKLLSHYPLKKIFELTAHDIEDVEGFAEKTAEVVVKGFRKIRRLFDDIYNLDFNLDKTPLITELKESGILSPIAGKQIVFTGTMIHGKRPEMQAEAKKLGAKVGSAVTGKTDYLVTGEKVGASKISAADSKGIKVLTEDEYLYLIKNK